MTAPTAEPPDMIAGRRRSEVVWMALIGIGAFVFSNAPRLWAALHTPSGQTYIGTVWAVQEEAWMSEVIRQAAGGHLISTARVLGLPPDAHSLRDPPYVLFGWLFGHFEANPIVILGWIRIVLEPAALAATALFIWAAVKRHRGWAYFVAVLAGGAGALVLALPVPRDVLIPMDITQPSFNVLNSLHMQPHVAWDVAGIALVAWGFVRVLQGSRTGFWGLIGVVMSASMHPWELLPLLLGVGFVTVALDRRALPLAYGGGAAAAALAAVAAISLLSRGGGLSLLAAWQIAGEPTAEVQNVPSVIVSSLFIWPLVIIGARRLAVARDPIGTFAIAWLAFSLLLGLLPFLSATPLHRTLEGRAMAMGVLAVEALPIIVARWRPYLAAACLISPLLQLPLLFYTAVNDPDLYLARGDVALARRMDTGHLQGSVYSDLTTTLWVAALSETRTSTGTWDQRPSVDEILAAPAQDRARLLRDAGADYLIWGAVQQHLHGPPLAGFRTVLEVDGSYLLAPT